MIWMGHVSYVSECKLIPCPHLSNPIERDGVTVTVKCGCNNKSQERMLPAHRCDEKKRCLPTARFTPDQLTKWEARKPESDIYQLCQTCELNPAIR